MAKRRNKLIPLLGLCILLTGCTRPQTAPAAEQSESVMAKSEQTAETTELSFSDMYSLSGGASRGLQFSDSFLAMDGKTVKISGYMAPPLKPKFNFFVLSKQPMSICPFCSSDADWPEDIVAVYVETETKTVANDTLLTVTGVLELGSYTDEDTGFVSQARIYATSIDHNR